jgi:hypothetical protein
MLLTWRFKVHSVRKTLRTLKLNTNLYRTPIRFFNKPNKILAVPIPTEMSSDEIKYHDEIHKNQKKLNDHIETLKNDRMVNYVPDSITLMKLVDLVQKQNELLGQIIFIQIKNQRPLTFELEEITNEENTENKKSSHGFACIAMCMFFLVFLIIIKA